MPTVLSSATVADAIEQTLEWLDQQGCGDRDHGAALEYGLECER